jgi:1-acyl-sn-glycerol-3-phosphate acyltransferase
MHAALRLPAKAAGLVLLVLAVAPVQALVLALAPARGVGRLPPMFHRAFARILGVRVETRGQPCAPQDVVYVANHLSYLDVSALGGHLRARFVAKDEVGGWPVFGALARLQRTLFVSRAAGRAAQVVSAMDAALAAGDALILFPEGTTSPGDRVLPFKSSAFAALVAARAPLRIQPVTLELLAAGGEPVEAGPGPVRDRYAYHADMALGPHLLAFMRTSGARLRVHFHAPLDAADWGDRKALAREAWQRVSSALAPASHAPAADAAVDADVASALQASDPGSGANTAFAAR